MVYFGPFCASSWHLHWLSGKILFVPLEFSKLVEPLFDSISYSASEIDFLRQLRYAGGLYSDFSKIIEKDKELVGNLLRAANQAAGDRLAEPIASVTVALSAIGFISARNFLARSIVQGHPKDLTPGGAQTSQILKFALRGEAQAEKYDLPAGDLFAAGLAFDILRGLSQVSDTIEASLLEIWAHGIQVASVASQLAAKLTPDHGLEKDLALDGIIHDIGKAVLAVRFPEDYAPALKNNPKYRLEASRLVEENLYGIPHDALGCLYLWKLGFLNETSWMTMYHHQPFLAQRFTKTNRWRTQFLWLSDYLCQYRSLHNGEIDGPAIARIHSCISAIFPELSKPSFTEAIGKLTFIDVSTEP